MNSLTNPEIEAKINQITEELISNIEKKNGNYFDFMEEFGRALPLKLLSQLLGLDVFHSANYPTFLRWLRAVSSIFETDTEFLKKNIPQVEEDSKVLIDWIRNMIKNKAYSPNGLIHKMVEAQKGEVNEPEIMGMIGLLLFAGL